MVYIISELCGQWGGSIRRAEQMILQSKIAGADAVKVQLWDTYRLPGENREKWEYLTMSEEQFVHLKNYSNKLNIDFFASAFHKDRFEWIKKHNIKINKIASSMLEWNYDLCKEMVDDGMETFVSLGKWENKNKLPFENNNVKYFHCVPKYPHNFDEALKLMPQNFTKDTMIGYSDHSLGISACIESVKRGARIIEKHFTVDKSLQSSTEGAHICSMTQGELTKLRIECDKIVAQG